MAGSREPSPREPPGRGRRPRPLRPSLARLGGVHAPPGPDLGAVKEGLKALSPGEGSRAPLASFAKLLEMGSHLPNYWRCFAANNAFISTEFVQFCEIIAACQLLLWFQNKCTPEESINLKFNQIHKIYQCLWYQISITRLIVLYIVTINLFRYTNVVNAIFYESSQILHS